MTRSRRMAALACLVVPACPVALGGCSAPLSETIQTVTVVTVPEGASCTVERGGASLGTVSPTPGTLDVQRASDDLAVSCTKDGYRPARVTKSAMTTRTRDLAGGLLLARSGYASSPSYASYSYPPRITVQLDPAPTASKPRR